MKKHLIRFFSLLLIAAVVYFITNEIITNWSAIESYDFNFNISLLIAASFVYAMAFVPLSIGWVMSLRLVGMKLNLIDAFLYFCITQPGKYVPGKIWIAVARTKFCKRHNIPHAVTFLSTGVEGFFEIVAGTYISLFALLQLPSLKHFSIAGVIVISALGLLLLVPHIFYALINIYLKLVRQPLIERTNQKSFLTLLRVQLIFIAGMFGIGLAQALFLLSFVPLDIYQLPLLLSIGVFSYVASILAFFSPSGLGVREGIWIAVLKKMAAGHIGVIFAFVSRLWMVGIEAILVMICLPIAWRRDKKLPVLSAK